MMSNFVSYGPLFMWFAWRPVWTRDRGWRWFIFLWRAREYVTIDSACHAAPGWVNYVARPERLY